MSLNTLILNVPDETDLDNLSEWFADVEIWAKHAGLSNLVSAANTELFHIGSTTLAKNKRREILARLKAIRREQGFMDGKVRVFVVHGRNNELKEAVARFLEKQGFEAVVLHEQANGGRTIIEKLEQITADVNFAVILYTADDEGADGMKRARQNVVFEHGYFMAKLGRSNVCVIMDDNIEKPSDNQGVLYIPRDDWRVELVRELRNVGLDADANLI